MVTAPDRHHETSLLRPETWGAVRLPPSMRPRLVIIVDAEEEFDWAREFSSDNNSVLSIAVQHRAHRILRRHRMTATYVVDYPVANQPDGYLPLRELMESEACEIGAQLHAWVSPPFDEDINVFNSYPGNLPSHLERRKLEVLTETIERNLGIRPRIYKAGRNGVGHETAGILTDLGYLVDTSVVPTKDFSASSGPSYRRYTSELGWVDAQQTLLELPTTCSVIGALADWPRVADAFIHGELSKRLLLPAVMARLLLLDQIKLTPEGITLKEAMRLTRTLYNAGQRVFNLTYHSPSLLPGRTPYTRTQKDVECLLEWIDRYLDFFFGELNGVPATCMEIYGQAKRQTSEVGQ